MRGTVKTAALLLWATFATAPALAGGEAVYSENCAVCHMANGSGVPYMQPALAGSAVVLGDPDAVIARVLFGSAADIGTDGGYGNLMPGFRQLNDDDAAAVITFVRANFGNDGAPVTRAQIAAVRSSFSEQGEGIGMPGDSRAMAEGAKIFAGRCEVCHFSTDASGQPLPSLSREVVLDDPARLITRVLLGSESTMYTMGFESQGMPAFDRSLGDDDIAALATYLRARFGSEEASVTADQVARVRAEKIGDEE